MTTILPPFYGYSLETAIKRVMKEPLKPDCKDLEYGRSKEGTVTASVLCESYVYKDGRGRYLSLIHI